MMLVHPMVEMCHKCHKLPPSASHLRTLLCYKCFEVEYKKYEETAGALFWIQRRIVKAIEELQREYCKVLRDQIKTHMDPNDPWYKDN